MNAKITPFSKVNWMIALVSSVEKDRPNPSWLQKLVGAIAVPISSTIFELLLLGFATFFPTYMFKVEHPVIIYCQITVFSITVAFFQGCRSLGYISNFKILVDNQQKYYRIFGAIAVIPLNLVALLYFHLYSQNPMLDPAHIKQLQLFTVFLVGLNLVVGILGSQQQYKTFKQNPTRGPMRFFYPSIGVTSLGWFIIFAITSLIVK